ncbi:MULTISPECIES: carboxymuconolactone decarboxylase family protein [Nocardioides]|uniref:Carboxymuconolactone decarboxylase family protein n=1 Tax=Nocardioides vastitatis TaxID=2568655 RepID=A0ABW0ZJ46_9ACTN|nr:carboxymuconolactone decarboxylase family protein [Nocardioides sp.]THI96069.1 carboxymuconolactone decarboxylase family protein [Nocardioides sp.]
MAPDKSDRSDRSTKSERFAGLPEARRRGLERMEQVYGFEMTDGTGDFFRYTVEHLFGDIWQRPGLTDRDRRLFLIGLLVGQRANDVLGIQIPAAYANDELDADALRELVILACHYDGWPNGSRMSAVVEDTIAKAKRAAADREESTRDEGAPDPSKS